MKRRVGGIVLGAAVLLAVGIAMSTWAWRRPVGVPSPKVPARVWLEDRPRTGVLPGDPEAGKALYTVQCASCHGEGGAGDGPAAAALWPRPRDHTDASYMNARTDDDLFQAIRGGGPEVGRSKLMPRWDDRFDALQMWALVAYVRTLAPAPPKAAGSRVRDREAILSDDRLTRAGGGPRRAPVHAFLDEQGRVTGYATYPVAEIEGVRAGLTLTFDAEARLEAIESHRRIRVRGIPAGAVDAWLAARAAGGLVGAPDVEHTLRTTIEAAMPRLHEAVGQLADDEAAAEALLQNPPADRGTTLFLASCASCHGATGRVVGPRVVQGAFRPRNFADGERMNALSDEYLREVIANGGLHWNLSSSMPAFRDISAEDVDVLVEHVRSLAVPRPDRACPCSAREGKCSMVDIAGHCRCRGVHRTGEKCPHEN
ncbi:MAG: c-type cytochrome [Planctomycetota bacterium]